jgi:hypothetical protein
MVTCPVPISRCLPTTQLDARRRLSPDGPVLVAHLSLVAQSWWPNLGGPILVAQSWWPNLGGLILVALGGLILVAQCGPENKLKNATHESLL